MHSLLNRLWSNAYLLLFLTAFSWGGNAVASRLAVSEVSPMLLTGLRWILVCAVLTPIYWSDLRKAAPLLMKRPWRMVIMSIIGFTAFNLLMYIAARYTTAVNIGLLQGAIPAIVFLGAFIAYRTVVTPLQIVGVLITMVGVAVVASGGDLQTLLSLSLNRGDVMMLVAALLYACYTVMVRDRPAMPGVVFFMGMALIACAAAFPAIGVEYALGQLRWPTPKGWLIVLFITLFPSLIAQIFFIRGIELIGPGRAGVFVNLVPVLASVLAVAILKEPFGWSHGIALALVLGGIALAERQPGRQ